MSDSKEWFVRTEEGMVYGPADVAALCAWAKDGRIEPSCFVSSDRINWKPAQLMPELEMKWLVETEPGKFFGPFHRQVVSSLFKGGQLAATAKAYRLHEFAIDEDPPPVEKIVEVEKVVEKIVEKEVRVEVPVEKIVEKVVEKVVVDETRVRELEDLLAEERRHTGELQAKLDAAQKGAAELRAQAEKSARAAQEASDREAKLQEQVKALEDELRRLPQAASEVADIQAAVYSIMTGEAEELGRILEAEKREFEAFKQRHLERADHLLERRREMLKRAGANIEDMTRKALRDRPEDPRTAQLRKELDDLRRARELESLESAAKVRELTVQLRERKAEEARLAENMKDVTQLRAEVEALREQLQTREKELVAERQHTEDIRRQQATRQQVLMNRLATLESPSIGTAQSMETNQSREAKLVRLPSWMRLGK